MRINNCTYVLPADESLSSRWYYYYCTASYVPGGIWQREHSITGRNVSSFFYHCHAPPHLGGYVVRGKHPHSHCRCNIDMDWPEFLYLCNFVICAEDLPCLFCVRNLITLVITYLYLPQKNRLDRTRVNPIVNNTEKYE